MSVEGERQADDGVARAINDLLCRFQQSFDDKDWDLMRGCLADRLYTDYSSFRDVPASEIDGDRYVAQRKAALDHLAMQHNFLNLRVIVEGATARARCNYVIHRFLPDGGPEDYFHSYGTYQFGFERAAEHTNDGWVINHITQSFLKNSGDPEIHGATRTDDNTRGV
jgi:hypothetical protein